MDQISQKFITKEELPLVIEPKERNMTKEELWNFVDCEREALKKQLLKYGGLLFRNFLIDKVDDFEEFINQLGIGKFIDYIGGDSPRTKIKGSIYTSTEAPPSLRIPLHNELSFVKRYPKHIYFYCEIAPQKDGETIIADARKIYRDINPEVRERFIERGLKYISRYYKNGGLISKLAKGAHKPWTVVFETDDKNEVERKCRENDFSFKWNKDNWLEISQVRPAIITHPETDEKIWFNQSHLFDFSPRFLGLARYIGAKLFYCRKHTKLHDIYYADGSNIPREDLYHVMDVLDKNTVAFPWQKGDILVLDNVLAMHGRAAFEGKRRILTAMTGNR